MRPIDADALQKAVTDLAPHPHDKWETIGVWHLIEHANTLTLDDPRPKGRWEKNWHDNSLIGHEYEECSACACVISDTEKFWDCNFCPNCGADMQGGGEDG